MKNSHLLTGAALLALAISVQAQPRTNNRGNAGGAALPLPDGVKSVVSIDAFNILLAETERDGQRDISAISIQHVYSGGIARLFGGTSIPTDQFVSPGMLGGGGLGSGGLGSFGVTGGNTGVGNNNSLGSNTGLSSLGNNTGTGNTNVGGNTGFGGISSFQLRPFGRN